MPKLIDMMNADTFDCELYSYTRGRSEMYIEVSALGTIFYLFFPNIRFFSGPNTWVGADFDVETPEACVSKARTIPSFDNLDDKTIQNNFQLYTIHRRNIHIEILAGDWAVVDRLPNHLLFGSSSESV